RRAASKRTPSIDVLEDPRTLLRPGFIARPQPAVIESAGSDALPADGMARIVGGRSPQADKSVREIAMCLKRRGSFVTIGLEFRGLPAYGGACRGDRKVGTHTTFTLPGRTARPEKVVCVPTLLRYFDTVFENDRRNNALAVS